MTDLERIFEHNKLKDIFDTKVFSQKSKGIDRISAFTYEKKLNKEIELIVEKVSERRFKFSPYLEFLILKSRNREPRLISIPTVRDRIVLSALKEILHSNFYESVRRRMASTYIFDIKNILKIYEYKFFIKLDIYEFYNSINLEKLSKILMTRLEPDCYELVKLAILNPTYPKNYLKKSIGLYQSGKGVPQGLPISNILAEIFISSIDNKYLANSSFAYFRYVDDILILTNDLSVMAEIEADISDLDLKINKDKKQAGNVADGFTYLGYVISNASISIEESRVQNFIHKIAAKLVWFKKASKNADMRSTWLKDDDKFKIAFIDELNEIITGAIDGDKGYGWIYYYKEMDSMDALYKIDKVITGFFAQNVDFLRKRPVDLKRISRAYYEVKYKGLDSNYLTNYNKIDDTGKKYAYLLKRGAIDPNIYYTDEHIVQVFEKYKFKRLSRLEKDEKDLTNGYR